MMLAPLLTRELRAEARHHRLRRERFVAGLMTATVLMVFLFIERWNAALKTFLSVAHLAGMLPFVLLVMGLTAGANLLSAERREGTLPLLLLTHLTGRDIVIGKLVAALFARLSVFLAMVPVLVLPLIVAGFKTNEVCLITLGFLNVLFFALALGILASLFSDGPQAASWALALLLPLLAYSSPFGLLLPGGPVREWLGAFQWLNPCDVLAHVPMAVAGVRPGAYWWSLFTSHAVAWGLIALAGVLLPSVCRWRAGVNADHRANKPRRIWRRKTTKRSLVWRARLLNRNAFHWLTSRERWQTTQVWLMVTLPLLGFGWLAWFAWAVRGLNITIVLVIAVAATWMVTLLVLVPAEASRRWVEDRNSGALELILCTSLSVEEMVRGQWLTLRRRFLPPLIAVEILSVILMMAGYVTYGFGGMLEPADRAEWLFMWLAGLLLLPLCLVALCWLAMRRSLFARTGGEASGIAFVQLAFVSGVSLAGISVLSHWAGWHPNFWSDAILLNVAFAAMLVAFAWRARRIFLAQLRDAAASRYFEQSANLLWSPLRTVASLWKSMSRVSTT